MRYDYIFVGITLTIAVISLLISLLVFMNVRKSKGIWQIGFLFVLEFIYALGYLFECVFSTLELKMFANHFQYLALPFFAITWLYIAKKFQNHHFVPNLKKTFPLLIIPIMVFITAELSFFTPVNLYYTNESIDWSWMMGNVSFPVLYLEKGVFYYLNSISNLFLTSFVFYVYIRIFFQTSGIRKKQSLALGLSSLLGIVAIIFTLFSPVSTGLDTAFFIIVITGFVTLYSIMKYEIIDLKPSAYLASFELSTDPIFAVDDKFDIVDWNQSAESFFSSSENGFYHESINTFFKDSELTDAVLNDLPYSYKYKGKHFIVEAVLIGKTEGKNSGYLIKLNDMTSYMERLENLRYDATHDVLTKILNRRAFLEQLNLYLENKTHKDLSYSIIMIDIDDFKYVNDNYGHVAGDYVLQEFSRLVSEMIPKEGVFARFGGEEFTILLRSGDKTSSLALGELIRQKIESSLFVGDHFQTKIKISVGASVHTPGCEHTVSQCIQLADEALYQSKKNGKNQVTVTIADTIKQN